MRMSSAITKKNDTSHTKILSMLLLHFQHFLFLLHLHLFWLKRGPNKHDNKPQRCFKQRSISVLCTLISALFTDEGQWLADAKPKNLSTIHTIPTSKMVVRILWILIMKHVSINSTLINKHKIQVPNFLFKYKTEIYKFLKIKNNMINKKFQSKLLKFCFWSVENKK